MNILSFSSLIASDVLFLPFHLCLSDNHRMQEELDNLEIKVSYLELKFDELNQVIIEQDRDLLIIKQKRRISPPLLTLFSTRMN